MSYITPHHLRPGAEGWTSFDQIEFCPTGNPKCVLRSMAPLWADGDRHHRVLVTRDNAGTLTVWTEDTPAARYPLHGEPSVYVVNAVTVPTVEAADVLDAMDGNGEGVAQ